MDSVIVFGGSGFLGSHVADALSDKGYHVKIFDLKPSPYLRDGQEMILGDIGDPEKVREAVKGCRYVYNFAGLADIDDAKKRPIDAVRLNVLGNAVLLDASREHGVKRFVFASSIYVYSDAGSFYRASKQAAELFVEAYQERFGLPYTILRYGSLYGRRADERNGMFRLIKQAVENGQIVYSGGREATREYIHVVDAAQESVRILDKEFANQHVILTGSERMRVVDVMRMISEMLPKKMELKFEEKTEEEHYNMTPYSFHPKIGRKLVSHQRIDLGQGLLDLFAEFHENRHGHTVRDGNWIVLDETNQS